MKKIFYLVLLIICAIDVKSQTKITYKCENIIQRDSIANDLKNKGFVKYEFDSLGLYICVTNTHNFWFSNEKKDYTAVNTIGELYSNVKDKLII